MPEELEEAKATAMRRFWSLTLAANREDDDSESKFEELAAAPLTGSHFVN